MSASHFQSWLHNDAKLNAQPSALDGLDAPVKQEHSGTVNVEAISTVRARLAKAKARRKG